MPDKIKFNSEQYLDAVFIEKLESHRVALIGEEAYEYCKSTDRLDDCLYPESSGLDTNHATPQIKLDTNRKILASLLRAFHVKTLKTHVEEKPSSNLKSTPTLQKDDISFNLGKGWEVKTPRLAYGNTSLNALSKHSEQHWQTDLSHLTFEQASLDKEQNHIANFSLSCKQTDIVLYNAPYLLSPARLTLQQRLELFSNLHVKVSIRYQPATGIFIVDFLGGDAKDTHIQFVGFHPDRNSESALIHWYSGIVPEICINEPYEVRHRYG